MDKECPRCGNRKLENAIFCPQCGARLVPSGRVDILPQNPMQDKATPPLWAKFFMGVCSALTVAAVVLIILYLNQPRDGEFVHAATPSLPGVMSGFGSPTPSSAKRTVAYATVTPEPSTADRAIGAWMAVRVEKNTQKAKEFDIVTAIGEFRTLIIFRRSGTALVMSNQIDSEGPQKVERTWYSVGSDIFIDKGMEKVGDMTLFATNRFFFKGDELLSVYMLDGKDASDFVVFAPFDLSEFDVEPEDEAFNPWNK